MKILITGAAGFIGFHLAHRLAVEGKEVVGLDNLNDYYDVNLKLARLGELGIKFKDEYNEIQQSEQFLNLKFVKLSLEDDDNVLKLFKNEGFDIVINLAAQAGVRYSLVNPKAYIKSNIEGFLSILEACRAYPVKHLIYASSSSVYGQNKRQPYSVTHPVDHPISLYAATKKSNELMAHTYSHLFQIPTTGLRFFTVYGPWGRPDMAYYKFTSSILEGKEIDVYNNGRGKRDFTYIDDIVEGIVRLLVKAPKNSGLMNEEDPSTSSAPFRLFNIGNHDPVELMEFIQTLEMVIAEKAVLKYLPAQPGDVDSTYAEVSHLQELTAFAPRTTLKNGLANFYQWYKSYHKLNNA